MVQRRLLPKITPRTRRNTKPAQASELVRLARRRRGPQGRIWTTIPSRLCARLPIPPLQLTPLAVPIAARQGPSPGFFLEPRYIFLSHFQRETTECPGGETDFFEEKRGCRLLEKRRSEPTDFRALWRGWLWVARPGGRKEPGGCDRGLRGCSRTSPTLRGQRWSPRPGRRCRPCARS